MTSVWPDATIAALLLLLVGSLWRVARGPTRADRMLSTQLFGTTGVGVLALTALATGTSALYDAALVLALLAATAMVVFVQRAGDRP